MSVCVPCEMEHHWLCNRARLAACDCDNPTHEDRPDPPRSILGERE